MEEFVNECWAKVYAWQKGAQLGAEITEIFRETFRLRVRNLELSQQLAAAQARLEELDDRPDE